MGSRRNDTLQRPAFPFILNRESEQARGLVGWWPMAPSGGLQCWDFGGFNNHGTLTNVPNWMPEGVRFDGVDDYVALGTGLAMTGDFSVVGWAKTFTTTGNLQIFSRAEYGGSYPQNWLLFQRGANWSFQVRSSVTDNECLGSGVIVGKLTHVIGTYKHANPNPTLKIYVDGILRNTDTAGVAADSATAQIVNIGGYANVTGFFNGDIHDVRLYNREITPAEVYRLWHPSTRHDLYYQPRRRKVFLPEAGDTQLGIASETDSAIPLSGQKRGAISFPSETDASQPLTAQKRGAVGFAAETDTSIQLTGQKRAAIGTATEADESQAVTAQKRGAIGFPTETDDGLPLGNTLELVSEADAALPLALVKRGAISITGETDTAIPLALMKRGLVGIASETDDAINIGGATLVPRMVDFALSAPGPVDFALSAPGPVDFALSAPGPVDFTMTWSNP